MLNNKFLKIILAAVLVVSFVFLQPFNFSYALEVAATEQTEQLQQELKAIEDEIAQYEKQLSGVSVEKNTLNKKINELKLQQSKINSQIKQTNLNLKKTESQLDIVEADIKVKQQSILVLQEKISAFIQTINKKDNYPALAIFVTNQDIGGFFKEMVEYRKIIKGLDEVSKEAMNEKKALEEAEAKLSENREDQKNLLSIKSLQNQELSGTLSERTTLLQATKEKESNYQAALTDRKKLAAEIKSRIYELLGYGSQVTFGQAVSIAQTVSDQTGVRASFLLAVLTQESNLGKNVGTCNRAGDSAAKSWKEIMPGPLHYANYVKNGKSCNGAETPCSYRDDQAAFLSITKELGMDPDTTPVSCPMRDSKGNRIGFGGAMGPAQFIPTTWLGYRAKVSAFTGKAANPWDIRDAFIAAALKLKNDGAGSVSGEWAAAMKYFSGSTNTAYRFYGDNVVATAKKYQQDIEDLNVK